MSISVLRLPVFAVAIILSSTVCANTPANKSVFEVMNIFGQSSEADQPEFLDPEEAFIVSIDAVAMDKIDLHWKIAEGYYLYKDKFDFSFADSGVVIIDTKLSEGRQKKDPDFGNVWVNYHRADVQLSIQKSAESSTPTKLLVKYQGCKEGVLCYPPINRTLPINFVSSAVAETIESNSESPEKARLSRQDMVTAHLSDEGFLQNIIIFFGFGLLLSLTPCVFPMVPILAGIIVGQGSSITTLRSFNMSLIYVLAMASTYAALGIIAGSFGLNLQAASQNIWIISAFSLVFVLLSLSMFGFYELQLPSSWQSKLSCATDKQGGTLHGVAIMGMLSAIIASPCLAPPLAGALLYISQTGDAGLGGFALFAMGLGMGVPLLITGTSAGKLLPGAGAWMESVKRIFGVMLLGVAVWFMERVLSGSLALMLWALLFVVTSIYMGALDRLERQSQWQGLWRGLGIAMLVYGIILIIGAASGGNNIFRPLDNLVTSNRAGEIRESALPYQMIKGVDGLQSALEKAANENKFVMLDFYADWCITCKEMERNTFSDHAVQSQLGDFVLLKSDVTENNVQDKALLKKFNLFGPPAILFFDKDGFEKKSYRVIGFMDANDFVKHIHAVIN